MPAGAVGASAAANIYRSHCACQHVCQYACAYAHQHEHEHLHAHAHEYAQALPPPTSTRMRMGMGMGTSTRMRMRMRRSKALPPTSMRHYLAAPLSRTSRALSPTCSFPSHLHPPSLPPQTHQHLTSVDSTPIAAGTAAALLLHHHHHDLLHLHNYDSYIITATTDCA